MLIRIATLLSFIFLSTPHSLAHEETKKTSVETGSHGSGWAQIKCSTLGMLLQKNGGKIPQNLAEFKKWMEESGDGRVVQSIIPLSRAIHPGSLSKPRKLLTVAKGSEKRGGLLLSDRLFVAQAHPELGSSVIEFISWNPTRGAFDFGLIENFDDPKKASIRVVPTNQCASCHKSEGPIFTMSAWSDTTENLNVWRAMVRRLAEKSPAKYGPVLKELERLEKTFTNLNELGNKIAENKVITSAEIDGLYLFRSPNPIDGETGIFDGSVVHANELLFFDRWLKSLTKQERHQFWTAALDGLSKKDEALLKKLLNRYDTKGLLPLMSPYPFRLEDYDPVKQVLNPGGREGHVPATIDEILAFDLKRQKGEGKVPDESRPTLSSAFIPANAYLDGVWESFRGRPLEFLEKWLGVTPSDFNLVSKLDASGIYRAELATALSNQKGIPSGSDLLVPLYVRMNEERKKNNEAPLPVPAFKKSDCETRLSQPQSATEVERGFCLKCHVGEDPLGTIAFSFDVSSVVEWKNALRSSDSEKRTQLESLGKKVLRKIQNGSMPPDKTEAKAFESLRGELIQFISKDVLKGVTK